jgi:glutaminyl-peptide cyclotransferase
VDINAIEESKKTNQILFNAHALPVLSRRMGSSTTAKRRPKQQPQLKDNKKLPDAVAGNKRQRGRAGGIATQPRRMENVSTTAAVSFVIMLMVSLVLAVRNIVFGGGGDDVAAPPTLVRPTPAPVPTDVDDPPPRYTSMGTYELLKTIPHDTSAFTQGLVTIQDQDGNLRLYEGTGMYGASELRILDLNGTVLERHILPSKYFGEGIVHFPLRPEEADEAATANYGMLQLTWRETTMFEYRLALDDVVLAPPIANTSFTSTNNNEGWGITYDPAEQVFYMTDGSVYVHVWDRTMRQEIRKFAVTYQYPRNDAPVRLVYLNELEWDPSTQTILANVLGQDVIVRIDPTTGFCTTIYDFGSIFPASTRPRGTDVFNGIALSYDLHRQGSTGTSGNQRIDPQHYWVTGKYWPSMYYVKLIDGIN